MPTYLNHCTSCTHEQAAWQSIHDDTHPDCPRCGRPTVRAITQVNTYAVGERGRHTAISDATDQVWHKDMDAYARFAHKGIQPQRITGCDKLEATAISVAEIESGGALRYSDERIAAGTEEAKQIVRSAGGD